MTKIDVSSVHKLAMKCDNAYENYKKSYQEAKDAEKAAFEEALRIKNIIPGVTLVKPIESDCIGVIKIIERNYDGKTHFYTIGFYPLKKDGKPSSNKSCNDSNVCTMKRPVFKDKHFCHDDGTPMPESEYLTRCILGYIDTYETVEDKNI